MGTLANLRFDVTVPEEADDELLAPLARLSGKDATLKASLIATREHRPEKDTVVIFHADEGPEAVAGINARLARQGDRERLVENPDELRPAQQQNLLQFACNLEWNGNSVADGMPANWKEELGDYPLSGG